jgi:hypothetical protein
MDTDMDIPGLAKALPQHDKEGEVEAASGEEEKRNDGGEPKEDKLNEYCEGLFGLDSQYTLKCLRSIKKLLSDGIFGYVQKYGYRLIARTCVQLEHPMTMTCLFSEL